MRNIIFYLLLTIPVSLSAQKSQTISVKGRSGVTQIVSGINEEVEPQGNFKNVEISVQHFFSDNWAITGGLAYGYSKTKSVISDYTTTSVTQTDSEGDIFTSHLYLYDWEEEQKVEVFEIPVLLSYKGSKEKLNFYSNVGVKLSIPFSGNYEVVNGDYENKGYYSQWNVLLSDVPEHFERISDYHPSGNVELKPSLALVMNFGLMYSVSKNWSLSCGLYGDYGLSNIQSEKSILIQEDTYRDYSGILNSDLMNSVIFRSVGIEFGVCYHIIRTPTWEYKYYKR